VTVRVLIVDDEEHARHRLTLMLRQIAMAEVVGAAKGGEEALALVRDLAPDVVLLDVAMPEMSGFDMLPLLDASALPVVIFVTAFHQHAVRAFESAATDYLLKPVAFDRLQMALERAAEVLRTRDVESRLLEMQAVLAAVRQGDDLQPAPGYETELWVQRRLGYVRVSVAAIEWVRSERDYVRLHTDSAGFLMRMTLGDLYDRLDQAVFLRVHRSYVVRQSSIVEVRRAGNGTLSVVLANGMACPVGRTYVDQVRSFLR
jgi:DNA-binding LytR/AlgR family response regulator